LIPRSVTHHPCPYEAATSRPKEATDVLARIARLYHEVETPCANMTPEERRCFRQEHAAPLLAGIFQKIEELRRQTTPSEPLRKAIDYTLNQRKALCRYLEDGRLRPDNNLAENAITFCNLFPDQIFNEQRRQFSPTAAYYLI